MRDGHGGITVGSEISGGVRNLFAEKCRLDSPNLDHALRVKNNATRGGLLENFYFRGIEVGQVAHAVITIDFNYEEGAKGNSPPSCEITQSSGYCQQRANTLRIFKGWQTRRYTICDWIIAHSRMPQNQAS